MPLPPNNISSFNPISSSQVLNTEVDYRADSSFDNSNRDLSVLTEISVVKGDIEEEMEMEMGEGVKLEGFEMDVDVDVEEDDGKESAGMWE